MAMPGVVWVLFRPNFKDRNSEYENWCFCVPTVPRRGPRDPQMYEELQIIQYFLDLTGNIRDDQKVLAVHAYH